MSDDFQLPEILDAGAAASVRSSLLERRGRPIAIDASGVKRVGALGGETLVSAALQWRQDGFDFRLHSPSDAFSRAMQDLGLHDVIMARGADGHEEAAS